MEDDFEEDEEEYEDCRAVCPICGESECKHEFARLDQTMPSCEGGALARWWDRLEALCRDILFERLSTTRTTELNSDDDDVAAIWEEAMSAFLASSGASEVSLDVDSLMRMVIEALRGRLVKESDDTVEGGPGMTNVVTVFYAEDHGEVYDQLVIDVGARLITGLAPPAKPKARRKKKKKVTPARRRVRASRGG